MTFETVTQIDQALRASRSGSRERRRPPTIRASASAPDCA